MVKRKKKRIVYVAVVAAVLLIIYLPGLSRLHELNERNQELIRKVEELKAANRELRQEKEALENDPVYLEKVARQRLGMVREGETIFKVTPSENNAAGR
jgi:cell division protein FtsB